MSEAALQLKAPSIHWAVDAEHRTKLKHERALWKEFARIHRSQTSALAAGISNSGALPRVETRFAKRMAGILEQHYGSVGKSFSHSLARQLPKAVKPTAAEVAEINAQLRKSFARRAKEQTKIINRKTRANAIRSLRDVQEAAVASGETLSRREVALRTGRVFEQRQAGRLSAITSYETQAAAEEAKLTEVQVLGGKEGAKTIKRWWSVGDHRVRDWHLTADQQERKVAQPFKVMGESLMQPGDTSMGASLRNVINCRCSAQYDAAAVTEIRKAKE